MQYVISSGYRTDQRLLRQGAICSVCQMTYTFVIKLESFDQDMRELCHQLNVGMAPGDYFILRSKDQNVVP